MKPAGNDDGLLFRQDISTDQANYDGTFTYGQGKKGVYRQTMTPVDCFPSNAWGLHDKHGNVWEWCSDWFGDYHPDVMKDHHSSHRGSAGVLRGGSWEHLPKHCRSAYRLGNDPDLRFVNCGCRVLLCLD